MQFKDQTNTIFELQKTPSRIVCLVPSLTELLVDLGLETSIVGVTKFCVHPTHLRKSKTIVGGTKNVHFDKIRELKPDIILCNKEENTKDIVKKCQEIAVVHVSDIATLQDTLDLILQYGTIFSCTEKATILVKNIRTEFRKFELFIANKETLNVAYFIWKNPWMAAGNGTFINQMLTINKFKNIFINKERYPEVDIHQLDKNVELILLSSEPYPFKEKDFISFTNKNKELQIQLVNGEYFSWYGSRLLKAFDYFKTLRESLA